MSILYNTENITNIPETNVNVFNKTTVRTVTVVSIDANFANLSQLFENCPFLETVFFPDDYEGLNVSSVHRMYADCPLLTTVSMANFKGSNAGLNVDNMFTNSNFLTNLFIHHSLLNVITLPNDYVHVNNYRWVSSTTENNETFTDLPLDYATFYVLNATQNTTITYSGFPIFYYEIEDVVPENHYIGINTIFDLDKTKFLIMNPEISQVKTQLFDNNGVPYMSEAGNTLESGKGYIMKINTFCKLMFGINVLNVIQYENNIMITLQNNVAVTTLECTLSTNGIAEFVQTVDLSDAINVQFDNWNNVDGNVFESNKNYEFELKLNDHVLYSAIYNFEIVETSLIVSFAISTYFYGTQDYDRDQFAFSSSDQDFIEVIPTNVISGFVKQSDGYYIQPSNLHPADDSPPYLETFRFNLQDGESLYIWYKTDRSYNDQPDLSILNLTNINYIAYKDTSDVDYTVRTYTGESIDLFPDSMTDSSVMYQNPIKWKLTAGVQTSLIVSFAISTYFFGTQDYDRDQFAFSSSDQDFIEVIPTNVISGFVKQSDGYYIQPSNLHPADDSPPYLETFRFNLQDGESLYIWYKTDRSYNDQPDLSILNLTNINYIAYKDTSDVDYTVRTYTGNPVDLFPDSLGETNVYGNPIKWKLTAGTPPVSTGNFIKVYVDTDNSLITVEVDPSLKPDGFELDSDYIIYLNNYDNFGNYIETYAIYPFPPFNQVNVQTFKQVSLDTDGNTYMPVSQLYNTMQVRVSVNGNDIPMYLGLYNTTITFNTAPVTITNVEPTLNGFNATFNISKVVNEPDKPQTFVRCIYDDNNVWNTDNIPIADTITLTFSENDNNYGYKYVLFQIIDDSNVVISNTYISNFVIEPVTDYSYSMVKPTESFATLSRSARKLQKYNAPTDGSMLTVHPGMCVVKVHDEAMVETYETWLRSSGESTVIFVNSENIELGFENIIKK